MTEQEQTLENNEEAEVIEENNTGDLEGPIIPPQILLGIAGISVLVAVVTALINGAFGVLGWAALAIAVLALVLTVVLAPQAAVDVMTGRSFRFGGTSILVTIVFLAVLITVYWFIENQNWTYDVSQTDQYSLNETNREAMVQFGADPVSPQVEITGFFDSNSVSNQERIDILLEDYVEASNGKITVNYVNPDRNPLLAQEFGATNGSLVVQNTQNDDPEAAELVNTNFGFDQANLSNAILAVSAAGEFRAYFVEVPDGIDINSTAPEGASDVTNILIDRFNWDIQQVSFVDLLSEESEYELNASGIDGDVLVIIGGSQELSPIETEFIIDYLDNGGSLVMFALPDIGGPSLAASEDLNSYLRDRFGLSYGSNIVLDPQQSINTADTVVAAQFGQGTFITSNFPPQSGLIAPFTRTVNITDEPPTNVLTYDLAQTGNSSYAKTIEELQNQNVEKDNDDAEGPLTIAAAAENTQTGARVVLFGSASIPANQLTLFQGAINLQMSFNSLVWATGFDSFVEGIPQVTDFEFNPADTPVTASPQQLNTINLFSLFVLPFGVLIIGGVVWFTRRGN